MKATPVVLGQRRQLPGRGQRLESTAAIVSGMNTLLEEVDALEVAGNADGSEKLLAEIRDLISELVGYHRKGVPDDADPSSEGERESIIPKEAKEVEFSA